MATEPDVESLLLPERARLFHIGLAKTGTTSLQHAAHARRDAMLEHGVRYPGTGINHRVAVSALMGRKNSWSGPGAPRPGMPAWNKVMREIDADETNRIFVTHEFASSASSSVAKKFVDELGDRTHIVVTLRGLGDLLASSWQQYVQAGMSMTLDTWLETVLGNDADPTTFPSFHRRKNRADLIDRWSEFVGPENVTVVVVSKSDPKLLAHSFEGLLGLPADTLAEAPTQAYSSNRTMTLPEAELVRRFNENCPNDEVEWRDHMNIVRRGAVRRLLNNRSPSKDEPKIPVPRWATDRANEIESASNERIRRSGVRVVGDLDSLIVPARDGGPAADDVATPRDVPTELLTGMFSAAIGRGAFFGPVKKPAAKRGAKPAPKPKPAPKDNRPRPVIAADAYTTRDLAKALRIRLAHKIRTGKSKPVRKPRRQ